MYPSLAIDGCKKDVVVADIDIVGSEEEVSMLASYMCVIVMFA